MAKRSTNLNRGHKSARLSARNVASLMDFFGITADDLRKSKANEPAALPVAIHRATAEDWLDDADAEIVANARALANDSELWP